MKFEKWFIRVTGRFEHFLFKLSLGLLIFMILTQVVMTNENLRSFLSAVDNMEGLPLEREEGLDYPAFSYGKAPGEEELFLVLEAEAESSLSKLKVLVDRERTYNFKDNMIEIQVKEGDIIEIDGRKYDFPVKVTVKKTSEEIEALLAGSEVITNGTIELLGWVITD